MAMLEESERIYRGNRKRALFIKFFLLAILTVSFLMVKKILNAVFPPPIPLSSITQLEEITALKMPISSLIVDSEYQRGMSPQIIAKISMKPIEWSKFKVQKNIANQWSDGCEFDESYFSPMKKRGWKINDIKKSLCLSGVVTPGRTGGIWVTADLDEKSEVIVYIYYQN